MCVSSFFKSCSGGPGTSVGQLGFDWWARQSQPAKHPFGFNRATGSPEGHVRCLPAPFFSCGTERPRNSSGLTRHTVHSNERWLADSSGLGRQLGADWWPGWLQIQSSRSVVLAEGQVQCEGRGRDSAARRRPLRAVARGLGRSAQGPARGSRTAPSLIQEAPESTRTIQDRWSAHGIAQRSRRFCHEHSIELRASG